MNQTILSFIFLLLLNNSFAQNAFNTKGEREGVWIGYHINGSVKYSGQFINGRECGIFKYYDLAGHLAITLNYLDTGLTSKATVYYPNGSIKSQGYYYNKEKSDLWVSYNMAGQKMQQENYREGVLDGESIYYYNNGTIAESYYYYNGEKNGVGKKFYKSGFLNMKCNYQYNLPHGLAHFYYNMTGEVLESRGMFNVGRKDSIWEFYNEQGILIKKENFSYED